MMGNGVEVKNPNAWLWCYVCGGVFPPSWMLTIEIKHELLEGDIEDDILHICADCEKGMN